MRALCIKNAILNYTWKWIGSKWSLWSTGVICSLWEVLLRRQTAALAEVSEWSSDLAPSIGYDWYQLQTQSSATRWILRIHSRWLIWCRFTGMRVYLWGEKSLLLRTPSSKQGNQLAQELHGWKRAEFGQLFSASSQSLVNKWHLHPFWYTFTVLRRKHCKQKSGPKCFQVCVQIGKFWILTVPPPHSKGKKGIIFSCCNFSSFHHYQRGMFAT